jgi:hypothetical protein
LDKERCGREIVEENFGGRIKKNEMAPPKVPLHVFFFFFFLASPMQRVFYKFKKSF